MSLYHGAIELTFCSMLCTRLLFRVPVPIPANTILDLYIDGPETIAQPSQQITATTYSSPARKTSQQITKERNPTSK